MNRRRFLALTGVAAVTPLTLHRRAQADAKFDFARLRPQIDDKVSAYMGAHGVPGVAIGVAYRDAGGPLQQEYFHYGVASRATNAPMDEGSIVLINSITKVFTSSLLALNLQHGSLRLDDPLQAYLPDATVPVFGDKRITLEHLATHRSGLPRDIAGQSADRTGAGLIKALSGYTLKRAPGAEYEYSNFAFALLGLATSRTMGASYDDLIAGEITGPLGMVDTQVQPSAEQKPRVAQNYTMEGQLPVTPCQQCRPSRRLALDHAGPD